jgi:hypothetical protein
MLLTDILEIAFYTGLFSVLGLLITSWMENNGYARKNNLITIIGVFVLVLLKTFFYSEVSWWQWSIILILGLIFALNRGDLWTTMNHGKWWWKQKDNGKS